MRVSVVIPCYNAAEHLEQAIGSVLCQSLAPYEVIVVDDGSTDDSLSVAKKFGDGITLISQPNAGASHARNVGASLATGEALMFLDADDVLGPQVLEALDAALYQHPGSIAIGPWYCLRKIGGQWVTSPKNSPPRRFGQDDLSAWLTGWFHTPCSVLWSKEAFARVGAWDQQAYVMDDGEIIMRAMAKGVQLVRASYGASFYRRSAGDEQSVSDARHTEAGLRSRLYAVSKVARVLEEEGKLSAYRAALGEAFEAIADASAGRSPSVYAECISRARECGGRRWHRSMRVVSSVFASKIHRAWRRHVIRPLATQTEDVPPQMDYGLDWNEHLMAPATASTAMTVSVEPDVSVVIPTYNRANLVRRTLNSVLTQTLRSIEVLVIDDASTDNTREVVAKFDDPRVSYIRLKKNSGVAAARNWGLREARGEFIAFLDSDDEWLPNKLLLQVERFQVLPEKIGLVYTGLEVIEDNGKVERVEPNDRGNLYAQLLLSNTNYGWGSTAMIRRSVVEKVGYFDENYAANEDWDYWLRLARHFEIDYVDEVLSRYYAVSAHDRKSLALRDDVVARARFYQKYRTEMRRANIAHRFLAESARRCLVPESWDPSRARRILREAFWHQPIAPNTYLKLLRSLIPRRGYLFLRRRWRRILAFLLLPKKAKQLPVDNATQS